MADNQVSRTSRQSGQHVSAALLTAAVALTDGVWFNLGGINPVTVEISGITNANVEIRVSNDPTQPLNTVHGRQAGDVVKKDGVFIIDYPVEWIKARIESYTAGTINANLVGFMF